MDVRFSNKFAKVFEELIFPFPLSTFDLVFGLFLVYRGSFKILCGVLGLNRVSSNGYCTSVGIFLIELRRKQANNAVPTVELFNSTNKRKLRS